MHDHVADPKSARSTFVTVVAWILIAIAGCSTLMVLLQNILLNTIVPFDMVSAQMTANAPQMPPLFDFMMRHFRLLMFLALVVSIVTLVASIGLLRRKEWARRTMIAMLALAVVWTLGNLVLQQTSLAPFAVPDIGPGDSKAAADMKESFQEVAVGVRVVSAILAIAFSVLYAWIIKRLMSAGVKAEFR